MVDIFLCLCFVFTFYLLTICSQMCSVLQHLSAALQPSSSPPTQPLLTSTLLELNKPPVTSPSQSPFPEDTIGHQYNLEFSKVSSVSLVSLSHSSSKLSGLGDTYKDTSTAALTVSHQTEVWSLSCTLLGGWMIGWVHWKNTNEWLEFFPFLSRCIKNACIIVFSDRKHHW